MKTLDRYVIRLFLVNFAILFAVLMLLFIVVDLIVDLDEFLSAGEERAADFGGRFFATVYTIADYYGPLVVLLYVFFSGLLVAGAMGFTLAAMLRTREMVAMVASGISLYRVAAPLLVAGIVLNALALPAQEFLIPAVAAKLARSKSQVEHEVIENFPIRYAAGEEGILLSAAELDAETQTLRQVSIVDRADNGMPERLIEAGVAKWDDARGGWLLFNRAVGDGFDGTGNEVRPGTPDQPYSDPQPLDFFPSKLSPTVLLARNAAIYSRLLPMSELQAMQSNPAVGAKQRGQIAQVIWGRFSLLVINVLVLVMGLPFFLQLATGNMLVQSLKAVVVCMGAWGTGLLMLQAGVNWLNPVAAAWLPVVIFLPLSALLLQRVRT